jgi:hypothetical protein
MKWEVPGKQSRTNPLAIRNVIEALMTAPHTYHELVDASGLHNQTVRKLLVPFRKAPRLVYIAAWHPDARGYPTRPAFSWGAKPDAKRQPLTNAERQRRVRERKKIKSASVFEFRGQIPL